jgi:hypothetical protein
MIPGLEAPTLTRRRQSRAIPENTPPVGRQCNGRQLICPPCAGSFIRHVAATVANLGNRRPLRQFRGTKREGHAVRSSVAFFSEPPLLPSAGLGLSLSIECDRKPFRDGSDYLFITAKLAKPDRWSIALHDVQAYVYEKKDQKTWTLLPDLPPIKFDDFFRMGFKSEESGGWPPR